MALQRVTSRHGLPANVHQCRDDHDIMLQSNVVIEGKIGSGMSSLVFRGHSIGQERHKRAIKVFDKTEEKRRGRDSTELFLTEVAILQFVKNRHIVSDIQAFDSPNLRIISMPFHPGGNLQYHLTTLTPEKTHKYFTHITRAVTHLHSHCIVHRDIKPANVVVSEQDQAVVIDMGLAKVCTTTSSPVNVAGTVGYMAPEMDMGVAPYLNLFKCDAFSLGATLWAMVFRTKMPRTDVCLHCLDYQTQPLHYRLLFRQLCHHNVEERYSVEDLVDASKTHPTLKSFFEKYSTKGT